MKTLYIPELATGKAKHFVSALVKFTLISIGIAWLPVKLFAQAPTLSYPSPDAFTLNTTVNLQPVSIGVNTPAFSTSQQTIASGFNYPSALAVDASGNTYVADYYSGEGFLGYYQYSVLEKIPPGEGTPVIIDNTNFVDITGLAVDVAGNIYVSDSGNGTVKEIQAGTGHIATLTTIALYPGSIVVDASGNVYVTSYYRYYNNNGYSTFGAVVQIQPGSGNLLDIASGFSSYVSGLALDPAGNFYVADYYNNAVIELKVGNNGYRYQMTRGSNFQYPTGVAVDATGNVYVNDSGTQSIKEIPVSGTTAITVRTGIAPSNSNNLAIDTHGNLYFNDDANNVVDELTIQTPAGGYYLNSALPAGLTFNNTTGVISGFANAFSPPTNYVVTAYNGYGTSVSANFNLQVVAPVNISYTSPQPYTVNTDITPLAPTASGVGSPGYASPPVTFGTGFNTPQGLAINTSGNVFVAEYSASDVKEIPAGGGAPVTFGSGFLNPTGVAVDASGFVYVADFGHSVITKLTPGGAIVGNIGTGFSNPYGLAVDAAGNVYAADWGNGAVKEIRASDGSTISLGTGFNYPAAVAVDGAGNVYVADTNNNAIKEILAGSGSIITLGSGFSSPTGIAVDALGNVYIADYKNYLVREIPASGGGPVTVGAGANGGSFGVAVDGAGDVYYTDQGYTAVEKIIPTGGYYVNQTLPAGLNFNAGTGVFSGAASVGSPVTNYTVTAYNAAGAASVGYVTLQVVVPAAPVVSYQSPQSLPVNTAVATLSPTGGGVSAPAYRTNPVTLASALNNTQGLALDAAGNIYVVEYNGNDVVKIPAGGGAPSQFASGFQNPTGVAVDAAGNVYVADLGHNVVTKLSAAGANLGNIGNGLNNPYGVAVDGAGNVYVAGLGNATIAEIRASDGSTVQLGSGFNNPTGVATDAAGNIYVADYGNNAIKEIQAGSGNIVALGAGFSGPSGVVVDALGNVYVADYKNYQVKEIPAAGGGPIVIGGAPNGGPFGIAVDGAGNVYFSDQGNNAVKEIIPIGGYFISSVLPPGISLNPVSGVISGAPTGLSPATNYTVTAYNAGGSSSTTLSIGVDLPAPTIATFSPSSGSAGTLVTINGTNLSFPTAITIGGQSAIVVSNTGSTLVAMVMPGATTGAVSITNSSGTANSAGNFVLTATPYPLQQQGAKLIASDNTGAANQGYSVSVSADGNTAIVGGATDNGGVGAAWIYTRNGGSWSQQGSKLVASDNIGAAKQGISVGLSADGNTAIVGGFADNSAMGAAWVYTRSGGTWMQQGAKLVASDNVGAAGQGYSVSLSADGNTAIVGGFIDNSSAGAAWVYRRSVGTWSQQGAKLIANDNAGAAGLGVSVSLSADGNTAIVGGESDNSNIGAAWVYTFSGGVWEQEGAKLVGTGSVGLTVFQGVSVSLSADGNTAAVGGFQDNGNQGAVWVYTRNAGIWTQQGSKLISL